MLKIYLSLLVFIFKLLLTQLTYLEAIAETNNRFAAVTYLCEVLSMPVRIGNTSSPTLTQVTSMLLLGGFILELYHGQVGQLAVIKKI